MNLKTEFAFCINPSTLALFQTRLPDEIKNLEDLLNEAEFIRESDSRIDIIFKTYSKLLWEYELIELKNSELKDPNKIIKLNDMAEKFCIEKGDENWKWFHNLHSKVTKWIQECS
jgi:hypothetical protein